MRAFLIAATAVALTSTSAVMWAAETSKAPEKLLCKSEPRTGTRFQRRSCVNEKERERRNAEHKKGASEMIDRPVICVGKEGCL